MNTLPGPGNQALPILSCTYCVFDGDNGKPASPLLQVDPSERPDVVDMFRVLRVDGPRRLVDSAWRVIVLPDGVLVVLDASLVRPVVCSLRLAFALDEHFEILNAAVTSGYMGITAEPIVTDLDAVIRSERLWFRVPPDLPGTLAQTAAVCREIFLGVQVVQYSQSLGR